jgi:hypothetical protein
MYVCVNGEQGRYGLCSDGEARGPCGVCVCVCVCVYIYIYMRMYGCVNHE